MDYLEILQTYPLATDVIVKWFTKKMYQSFEDESVPGEIKEFMETRGISEENLAKLIEQNPRMLFDVFDENNIIIEITSSNRKPVNFGYLINREKYGGLIYESRRKAEAVSVTQSFRLLNEKLEKNETDNGESI